MGKYRIWWIPNKDGAVGGAVSQSACWKQSSPKSFIRVGGTWEAHKEARGIHPNSSGNVAFNAIVPVVQCTGFVSHTDPVRGSVSGSWLAHLPHPKPLLSCFVSYCQTYIF